MNRITTLPRVAVALAVTLLLGLLGATAAEARKVGNPGPVTFTFNAGALKVGKQQVDDAASGDDPITFAGTVQSNGALTIPNSSMQFPPIETNAGGFDLTIRINPVGDGTGSINPFTGATNLTVRFWIKIDGVPFGGGCRIASAGNPIVLNLTTGTSGAQTGVPYNTATGVLTLVDGLFSVPGASDCGPANGTVNDEVGLPSPSGNNYARLTATTTPKIQPGVTAAFSASPSTGLAPLSTTLNGAASTGASPLSYRWDFTNDGTVDHVSGSPTANTTYSAPGVYTARLTVVDADGDSASTTRQITAIRRQPDAEITKSVVGGSFVTGATHEFAIDAANVGSAPTSGPIVVNDAIPAGLQYAGASGDGWSCDDSAAPAVTCTYAGTVPDGQSAPQLRLRVVPDGTVLGDIQNTATVSTHDDPNATNNSSSATATVVQAGIDLAVRKTHDPQDGLFRGRHATYRIDVANDGTLATHSRIRVVDVLPADVTYVGASGPGWTCLTGNLPQLRCFTDEVAGPGESLPRLNIRVAIKSGAADNLDNTATVSTDGDSQALNNSSTDHGYVSGYAADLTISKTHSGDFLAGERGDYTIRVRNEGAATTNSEILVSDQLPAGLVPTSAAGTEDADDRDWTCQIDGQLVLCTHPGPVESGVELEAITIGVDVTDEAVGTPVNVATVASADDANAVNNSAYDETLVRSPRPDVAIDKSHTATSFTAGQNGTYRLEVTNLAEEPTRGTITVTDQLPAGLGFVSAGGTDWSCGASGQTVTCTRDASLRGGDSSAITLVVSVAREAAPGVTNVATVATANDTNADNNRDEDPTTVVVVAAPTTLEADGAVLTVYRQGIGLRWGLDGVKATLRSNGKPVVGRRVHFFTSNGTPLCSGVTDPWGDARCGTLVVTMLAATLGHNYQAVFAGDEQFGPSSALGPIVALPRVQIL